MSNMKGVEIMKRITVELENDFHKKVKIRALSTDKTMKDYVLDIIKKEMSGKEEQDAEHSDF